MNESGEVHDDVRKIVLNSIKEEGSSIKLVNPLPPERVTALEKKSDK